MSHGNGAAVQYLLSLGMAKSCSLWVLTHPAFLESNMRYDELIGVHNQEAKRSAVLWQKVQEINAIVSYAEKLAFGFRFT